jgi:hypothetical protein
MEPGGVPVGGEGRGSIIDFGAPPMTGIELASDADMAEIESSEIAQRLLAGEPAAPFEGGLGKGAGNGATGGAVDGKPDLFSFEDVGDDM